MSEFKTRTDDEKLRHAENETFSSDLDSYRKAVRTLAAARSPYLFQNATASHASVVIETILEFSKNEVFIFDDQLSGDISEKSPQFLNTLQQVVSPGANKRVSIVVERRNAKPSRVEKTLKALYDANPASISVRLASEEFYGALMETRERLGIDEKIHFTVGDDRAFRLEIPPGARTAYCSFNGPKMAGALRNVFIETFDSCEDYFRNTGELSAS
jgi:hypothetical protein